MAPIRLPRDASWTLAQRMAAERDSYGFYFSAHPVDAQRHLLADHNVRTFAELAEMRIAEGERSSATMAALAESVRWRVSARGRRYLVATLSDRSGQFEATVFDDEPSESLENAAKAGGCGLLTVELDRRAGDDAPRVTVKRFQPLEALAKKTRLQMIVRVADARSAGLLSGALADARGGSGIVKIIVPLADRREAMIVAGRDFALDGELAARIERITGEGSVELSAQEPPRLALVG
jgi:DNA polymerase-3 subunit alpha